MKTNRYGSVLIVNLYERVFKLLPQGFLTFFSIKPRLSSKPSKTAHKDSLIKVYLIAKDYLDLLDEARAKQTQVTGLIYEKSKFIALGRLRDAVRRVEEAEYVGIVGSEKVDSIKQVERV